MPDPNRPLNDGKIEALRVLKQALEDAHDAGREALQYAVTKASLLQSGATESDLHWLLDKRYVDEVVEVTGAGETTRQFRAAAAYTSHTNACFVLSHGGKVYVEQHRLDARPVTRQKAACSVAGLSPCDRIRWNRRRHELWVDGKLAKRYRRAAPAQWAVLDAFTEANWEAPLAFTLLERAKGRRNYADRLREVVAKLNTGLDRSLISFRMNGEGTGLLFDLP